VGSAAPTQTVESEPAASLVVIDGDAGVVAGLTSELEHRYGRDYHVLGRLSARSGLAMLRRLDATGRPVALVVSGLDLPDMPGPEFLGLVRSLHPQTKRVLLVQVLDVVSGEALHRAMTLGQADAWLTRPWAHHDEALYAQVGDLLDEWREDSGRQQSVTVHMVGEWGATGSWEFRDLLHRHAIPYRFLRPDSVEGRELLRRSGRGPDRLPVLVLFDGRVLVQPARADLAAALGHPRQPDVRPYDVAVVGGGMAGLTAAVNATSEGLRTIVIERETFGGQAGTSFRIRSYPGFPRGISGRRLAIAVRRQALLFGADLLFGEATGLGSEETTHAVLVRESRPAVASVVVIATGVSYRRLGVPAAEALVGAGVFYGAAVTEAPALRGEEAVVVGGGNSAGQAAVHLSRFARRVTLVARGDSLEESMSAYLVDELRSLENVTVRLRTQVVGAGGSGRLDRVTLEDAISGAQETIPAAALFVLIGGEPRTEWLPDVLERDQGGYIRTGRELASAAAAGLGAVPARMPLTFESSLPGVFAIGDVRSGAVKRMATAVGDGSMVIRMVHDYLSSR